MLRPEKRYLFFIQDGLGNSYYLDGYSNNGIPVIKSGGIGIASTLPVGKSLWLNYNPKGWADVELAFGRNDKYFAIFRSFTTPFEFVQDGADVLRYLYLKKGFGEKAYLVIQQHNGATDTYDPFYKGQLDFSKIDDTASFTVKANFLEGGLVFYLLKNDAVTYEIECNPGNPDTMPVLFDGIKLYDKQIYNVPAFEAVTVAYATHALLGTWIRNEGDSVGTITGSQIFEEISNPSGNPLASMKIYANGSSNYFFSSAKALTGVRLKGSVTVYTPLHNRDYRLYLVISGNITHALVPGSSVAAGKQATFVFDILFDLPADGKCFLCGYYLGTTDGYIQYRETEYSISYGSIGDASIVSVIQPLKVFKTLVDKMTDGKYTADSVYLTSNKTFCVSSGQALRELRDKVTNILSGTIKTSFEDYFKSFDVVCGGLGLKAVNNVLWIEPKQDLMPATTIMDAGESSDLQISFADGMFFNQLTVGFLKQDYGLRNGLYEFNDSKTFTIAFVPDKKELKLVSPYRGDGFGVEFIRGRLNRLNTTDDQSDNDSFIIDAIEQTQINLSFGIEWIGQDSTIVLYGQSSLQSLFPVDTVFTIISQISREEVFENLPLTVVSTSISGSDLVILIKERPASSAAFLGSNAKVIFPAILNRPNYTSITGVLTNTVFNTELSPKRILLRWGSYIRSIFFQYGIEKLIFQSGDKNKDLVTTIGGVTISEKADIRIDTLSAPYFYPIVFSFKTRVPDTFLNVMNAATLGQVKTTFNGKGIFGFCDNMTIRPVLNEAQTWKLLASVSTVLDDLLNTEPLLINDPLMSQYRLSFAHLCPLQMVPVGEIILPQYNSKHMDSFLWQEQIGNYIQKKNYLQKWQTNDIIKLQCFTANLGPVQADLFTCKGKLVDTISFQLISTVALQSPYQLYQANISLQNYPPDIYYVIVTAGLSTATVQFISEGFHLETIHPKTKLFNYSHNKNKLATIFSTGYNPDFRVECDLKDFEPGARFSTYEDEPADIDMLEGIPYRKFKLNVGRGTYGLPAYMIDKLNRIMLLNEVFIDGKRFTRDGDVQFEAERVSGVPGAFWTLTVREGRNRQAVSLDTNGNLERSAVVAYNIETKDFGDFAGQVSSNVVQVERVENTQ